MIGFGIGLAAGAWHLGLTAARAKALARGGTWVVYSGLPLAWAGLVAGLLFATQVVPDRVAWVLPGLLAARLGLMAPLARWVGR